MIKQFATLGFVGLLLIGGIVFATIRSIRQVPAGDSVQQGAPVRSFPQSSPSQQPARTTKTMTVRARDGSSVTVADVTAAPDTPVAGSGMQRVAGGPDQAFEIRYIASGSEYPDTFELFLQRLPLGSTRAAAESALRSALGVSDATLCQMAVSVVAAPGLTIEYDSQELGLSFCAGAIPLP